ncbi:hypothetical protein PR048_031615 [Dryococelus australis]|uniref:Uncharacterized protein n=1 Tax=Dryococelus australis TaxID=614101 RepID=A0ABQ9G5R9_9NEOP|nr:hypothetical protein PR048_031615 [Dryococelus australis]
MIAESFGATAWGSGVAELFNEDDVDRMFVFWACTKHQIIAKKNHLADRVKEWGAQGSSLRWKNACTGLKGKEGSGVARKQLVFVSISAIKGEEYPRHFRVHRLERHPDPLRPCPLNPTPPFLPPPQMTNLIRAVPPAVACEIATISPFEYSNGRPRLRRQISSRMPLAMARVPNLWRPGRCSLRRAEVVAPTAEGRAIHRVATTSSDAHIKRRLVPGVTDSREGRVCKSASRRRRTTEDTSASQLRGHQDHPTTEELRAWSINYSMAGESRFPVQRYEHCCRALGRGLYLLAHVIEARRGDEMMPAYVPHVSVSAASRQCNHVVAVTATARVCLRACSRHAELAASIARSPPTGFFAAGSPVSTAPPFQRRSVFTAIALIGSRDLVVKSCSSSFQLVLRRTLHENTKTIKKDGEVEISVAKREWNAECADYITAGNAAKEAFVVETLRQQDVQRWGRAVHRHASSLQPTASWTRSVSLITKLIVPVIVHNRLDGGRHLHFLQNLLPEYSEDVPLARMHLRQDGGPAHSTRPVTQVLNETYPGQNALATGRRPCTFHTTSGADALRNIVRLKSARATHAVLIVKLQVELPRYCVWYGMDSITAPQAQESRDGGKIIRLCLKYPALTLALMELSRHRKSQKHRIANFHQYTPVLRVAVGFVTGAHLKNETSGKCTSVNCTQMYLNKLMQHMVLRREWHYRHLWSNAGMKGREEKEDTGENPPTSSIVRHESHIRKLRGIRVIPNTSPVVGTHRDTIFRTRAFLHSTVLCDMTLGFPNSRIVHQRSVSSNVKIALAYLSLGEAFKIEVDLLSTLSQIPHLTLCAKTYVFIRSELDTTFSSDMRVDLYQTVWMLVTVIRLDCTLVTSLGVILKTEVITGSFLYRPVICSQEEGIEVFFGVGGGGGGVGGRIRKSFVSGHVTLLLEHLASSVDSLQSPRVRAAAVQSPPRTMATRSSEGGTKRNTPPPPFRESRRNKMLDYREAERPMEVL